MLGITLPDIDYINVPRFSLPLGKINYAALISRAYYYYKKDDLLKEKKKKKGKDLKVSTGEEQEKLKHMKTGIAFSPELGNPNKTQKGQTHKKLLLSKTMKPKTAEEIDDELEDDDIASGASMQDTERKQLEKSSSRKKDNH